MKIGEKNFLQQTKFMNSDFYIPSETMALNKSFRAKRRLIRLNNYCFNCHKPQLEQAASGMLFFQT